MCSRAIRGSVSGKRVRPRPRDSRNGRAVPSWPSESTFPARAPGGPCGMSMIQPPRCWPFCGISGLPSHWTRGPTPRRRSGGSTNGQHRGGWIMDIQHGPRDALAGKVDSLGHDGTALPFRESRGRGRTRFPETEPRIAREHITKAVLQATSLRKAAAEESGNRVVCQRSDLLLELPDLALL